MNPMIEEVARALCREIGVPEDGLIAEHGDLDISQWTPCWQHQLPKARAAIVAMRDPTPEMIEAGLKMFAAWEESLNYRPEDLVSEIYRQMHDEALK